MVLGDSLCNGGVEVDGQCRHCKAILARAVGYTAPARERTPRLPARLRRGMGLNRQRGQGPFPTPPTTGQGAPRA